jgi:hypothetical protein
MTVTYTDVLATSRNNLSFLSLIFTKWRGSLMKLVWKDLACFLICFYCFQGLYFLLDEEGKHSFRAFVTVTRPYADKFPVSFLLGFFVSNGEIFLPS